MDTKRESTDGMNWEPGSDIYIHYCEKKEITMRTFCIAQKTLRSARW